MIEHERGPQADFQTHDPLRKPGSQTPPMFSDSVSTGLYHSEVDQIAAERPRLVNEHPDMDKSEFDYQQPVGEHDLQQQADAMSRINLPTNGEQFENNSTYRKSLETFANAHGCNVIRCKDTLIFIPIEGETNTLPLGKPITLPFVCDEQGNVLAKITMTFSGIETLDPKSEKHMEMMQFFDNNKEVIDALRASPTTEVNKEKEGGDSEEENVSDLIQSLTAKLYTEITSHIPEREEDDNEESYGKKINNILRNTLDKALDELQQSKLIKQNKEQADLCNKILMNNFYSLINQLTNSTDQPSNDYREEVPVAPQQMV